MRELRDSDVINALDGEIRICATCGYWGGRGTRFESGPNRRRGTLGQIQHVDINSTSLQLGELLGHLRRIPDSLLELSAFRAERVVLEILSEVLACEVRPVGGVKDKGIDGYIVAGDELKTIVQVKWHRNTRRAESVKVVREFAGTLVARAIPRGLLVTTSAAISPEAKAEIQSINEREVVDVGRLEIDVSTYNDVLDMLDLAWTRIGADFESLNFYLREEAAKVMIFDHFDTFDDSFEGPLPSRHRKTAGDS